MCASRYATSWSGRRGGLAHAARVEPEVAESLAQGESVGIRQLPPRGVPLTGHGRRAQQGLAEPRALLIAEGDDLEGEGEGAGCRALIVDAAQQPHDLERHQHPDDAVVAPRVGHRVEVRAEQQGGSIGHPGRSEAADLVARGVLPGGHAELAHPFGGEAVDARVLGREVDAGDRAGRRGDAGELFAAPHDAARGRGDALFRHLKASGCRHAQAPRPPQPVAGSRTPRPAPVALTLPPPRTRPARPRLRRRTRPRHRAGAAPPRGRRGW